MDSKREYSEIEIEVAKNLLEEGYRWIARDKNNDVYAYCIRPVKGGTVWSPQGDNLLLLMSGGARGVIPIFDGIRWEDEEPVCLRDIVQILTDEEREWLRTVVKPFRNRLKAVKAYDGMFYGRYLEFSVEPPEGYEQHGISRDSIQIPKDSFAGMEDGKKYTPEELGI